MSVPIEGVSDRSLNQVQNIKYFLSIDYWRNTNLELLRLQMYIESTVGSEGLKLSA